MHALRFTQHAFLIAILGVLLGTGCGNEPSDPTAASDENADALFRDVTETNLPTDALGGYSMDAMAADVDADGDLDVVIAHEYEPNILLLNAGNGTFSDASDQLPAAHRDSEDVGIADFDSDGDLDIVVVSEDDAINEYYLNDGSGTFTDAGDRWPVTGTSNAVVVADLTGDGAPDILVGNNGQDAFLVNDGSGQFIDETADRLPSSDDVTQDLELGDVDGDGDLDLLVGNEDDNKLYINDGSGRFADESGDRIPLRDTPEETREGDFGDVDSDGDLDILFANVQLFVDGADPQNRLLINDGTGVFTDETSTRLPTDSARALDGDLVDLDADSDLDIITSNVTLPDAGIRNAPYEVFENDGTGTFTAAPWLPASATGRGLDSEAADFNGDGRVDLYLSSRGTVDRLLFGRTPDAP
jgi:hypothetical protein